ncbi:MAG: phosphoribosylformylglycinamidine synthase, partial [Syntrophales bacterium]|nr:phosphoribosylformylglycinamidine synthase [Syntrophales bacterium]
MAHRIEIGFKTGIRDALGEKIKRRITENLGIPVENVKTVDVYTIDGNLSMEELEVTASGPLCDHIIQHYAIDGSITRSFDWMIEVGFRPGVTDNVGKTAREAVELVFGKSAARPVAVYTSRQYILFGRLSGEDAERIAANLLANDLIERYDVVDGKTWDPAIGMPPFVPRVTGIDRPHTAEINLAVDDQSLVAISNEGVLALTLEEMKILQAYMKDET